MRFSLGFARTTALLPLLLALAGWLLLVVARIAFIGGAPDARLAVLPGDHGARFVNRIFEERDAAILGARLLAWIGVVPAREFPALPALLAEGYDLVDAEVPQLGTPVPGTYLGLSGEDDFDAYVFEPAGDARGGVVFLHGFAGNFLLQCWEVARAARSAGAITVCPSTGADGAWWEHDGRVIAERSVAYLRERGAERVVLVGLSNGAAGASLIANRLDIDGLVLLSGTSTQAPTPTMPTLVLHGSRDGMMGTARVRRWAREQGARVRYLELEGTHFVLLEQRERVQSALAEFVDARLAPRAALR